MEIDGRVALITGASGGIGLATARLFAQRGARLALVARSADLLAQLAEELKQKGHDAAAVPADMRNPEQVKRAVDETVRRFGRLDVLINNAGQGARGSVADVNPDHFRQIVDLNVFGPLLAMQAAIPIMRKQGGGLIINISSRVSLMRIPGIAAYAATKAALNMLSATAHLELAPDNIRVITVFPRITATDFGRNYLGGQGMPRRPHEGVSAPVDTAEFVAEKILSAAINEPEDQQMDQ